VSDDVWLAEGIAFSGCVGERQLSFADLVNGELMSVAGYLVKPTR